MRAIVRDDYGSTDVLRLEEIPRPTPADNEVRVKIAAASIAKGDWEILRGEPLWVRLVGFGFRRPRIRVLGYNFSGRVDAVGEAVTEFAVGDTVFGDLLEHGLGAFAEYVCFPENAAVARQPTELSCEAACSLPESGFIGVQAIRRAQLKAGQSILINGGAGGAGSFAIQLANSIGAIVTAIDRTDKQDYMRSLGAKATLDYTTGELGSHVGQYDLILDVVGVGSMRRWRRLLAPTGVYLAAGGSVGHILRTLCLGGFVSATSRKTMSMLAVKPNKDDLEEISRLVRENQVKPTIDQRFSLADTPRAISKIGEGSSKGKVVITTDAD